MNTTLTVEQPEGLDAKQAARLCGVSQRHWLTLAERGIVPPGLHLGRRVVWSRTVLVEFLRNGAKSQAVEVAK